MGWNTKWLESRPGWIFGIVSAAGIGGYYSLMFLKWCAHLPGGSEDSVKNFFTLAYHVAHGPIHWFEGMNYPFGEHLVYTDSQPLLAIALKVIGFVLPVSDHLYWLLPLLIIASMWLGSWLLFQLINGLSEPKSPWLHAFFAVGIILLSPQWQRITGHYSLGHGVVIPLVMLGIWRTYNGLWHPKWMVLILLASGFIHPYFLVMGSIFSGAFFLLLEFKKTSQVKKPLRSALLLFIGPIAAFQLIMLLTDPVGDRPVNPFGFIEYRATLRSILLPLTETIPEGLVDSVELLGDQSLEGGFYLGLVAIVALLVSGIQWITVKTYRSLDFAALLLLASLPVLALSLALPFSVWKFHHLLDFMGPLKQFRGIGRFAFVGFYAVNLFAAVRILSWVQQRKIAAVMVWAALIVLWGEAWVYRNYIAKVSISDHGQFSTPMNVAFDSGKFKAILPLPFFHTGSENFRSTTEPGFLSDAMSVSLKSGLPLVAVQLSRTSLAQTIQSIALTKHIMEVPSIAFSHQDEEWLLMVDSAADIPAYQSQLLGRSVSVFHGDRYHYYSYTLSSYMDVLEANREAANYLHGDAEKVCELSVSMADSGYYFEDYYSSVDGPMGRGSKVYRKDWTPLWPGMLLLPTDNLYELTFWLYANEQGAMATQVWFWERNEKGEDVHFEVSEVGDHVLGFSEGWALCKMPLERTDSTSRFEVLLHRDGPNGDLWIDDVMVRPLQRNLVLEKPFVNINNRCYKPSAP